ncbi:MAG: alpha/beta fold hydrolase [Alphaproteobacteria bacterium]|nr:alpha/beta fold hydrolase [Alphaproteobacteria bacterium]MBN2779588.1 alpha/beta fold hydrolase [Alphaproteobacteria bacterium]
MFNFFKRHPKPFNSGYLPTKDGHDVFFQEIGNPTGKPILVFHGGPGSQYKPKHAKMFNLKKYRIIGFDQRGSGQSKPYGKTENNTTGDILKDAKRLLDSLKIKKCMVSGVSWGSTVALLFAQKYPETVSQLAVGSIFLARDKDEDWCFNQSRIFYPDMMEKITSNAPSDYMTYYANLLKSKTQKDRIKAKRLLGEYESMVGSLNPSFSTETPTEEDIKKFGIFMHYSTHDYFLKDNQILNDTKKIKHIPTLILHNRLDMNCPVEQAWELHKALPKSKLIIVPELGHGGDLMRKTIKTTFGKFLK